MQAMVNTFYQFFFCFVEENEERAWRETHFSFLGVFDFDYGYLKNSFSNEEIKASLF